MLRPGVPTGKLRRTALFIAAERGLEAAVLMLIEGNRHPYYIHMIYDRFISNYCMIPPRPIQ